MNIFEVNKIMSSPNKGKLIAHFWSCDCKTHGVLQLCGKINVSQSCLSKHVISLKQSGVLGVEQKGKEKYYFINQNWKKQWSSIIQPMLALPDIGQFMCNCPRCKEI